MNFLVKKAISPSNFSRPPPTIAPLPAPPTPASRPLYPRFRTLYPRFCTLYPRTPAPPVHPLFKARRNGKRETIYFCLNFSLFPCTRAQCGGYISLCYQQLGLDARKPVFGVLRTTKAQTSMHSLISDFVIHHI